MPFDASTITDERLAPGQGTVVLSWSSTLAGHAVFQVYGNRALLWSGKDRRCVLPYPREWTWYDVGAVDPGEANVDLSDELDPPPGGGNRPRLRWSGGSYTAPNLSGFRIYGEASPGNGIDYATALDFVPAGSAGVIPSGFGRGGFGAGRFGSAGVAYEWVGPPRSPGTWSFAVLATDAAGRTIAGGFGSGGFGSGGFGGPGVGSVADVVIAGPPRPPAIGTDADGNPTRLSLSYDDGTQTATLTWLASPA
jgi:hypothetical protein